MRCFADIHLSSLFVHHYDFVWLHRIGAAVGKGSEHHATVEQRNFCCLFFLSVDDVKLSAQYLDFHSLHVDDERMSGVFGYLVVSLAFKFNLAIVLAEILWCILDAGERIERYHTLVGQGDAHLFAFLGGDFCQRNRGILPVFLIHHSHNHHADRQGNSCRYLGPLEDALQGELLTGSYLFMNFGLDTCQIFVRDTAIRDDAVQPFLFHGCC